MENTQPTGRRQSAGAPRMQGVPGQDAFKDLPKRKPPNLPGYAEEEVQEKPLPETPVPEEKRKPDEKEKTRKERRERAERKKSREKPERKEEKTRKKREVNLAKRRRNRRIVAIAGIVVLIVAGLWFSLSVLFKIERFSLQGESPYTQEEITEVFGYGPGDNMFGFNASTAATRIEEQLPYVEEVEIRRRLPGTVVFRVSEAQEAYSLPWEDGWAVLSTSRKVLRLTEEQPEGLVALYGITGVLVDPGKPLSSGEEGNGYPYSYEEYLALTAPPEPQEEPPPVAEEQPTPEEGAEAPQVVPEEGEQPQAEAEAGQETLPEGEGEGEPPTESASVQSVAPEEEVAEEQEPEVPEPTDLDLLGELLAQLSSSGIQDVNWVDVSDPLNLRFRWEDRITVELGARNNLPEKFKFVSVLLLDGEKSQLTAGDRGVLDVSGYPDTTDRVWLTPE